MHELQYLIIGLVTICAGAINSVAGGGTFLTFPVLIFNGLSPISANVMSTVALWPGSIASAVTYRKQLAEGDYNKKQVIHFVLISLAGSALGTLILLGTPERTFERLIPWLLLAATLVFTFGRRGIARLNITAGGSYTLCYSFQFIIALYGGYFGAGAGILMLAMLQLMGMHHIHKMNALKTILGSAINLVAVFLFIMAGKVIWPLALFMMACGILGGFLGARLALLVSPEKIRGLVILIGFAMTTYFFLR